MGRDLRWHERAIAQFDHAPVRIVERLERDLDVGLDFADAVAVPIPDTGPVRPSVPVAIREVDSVRAMTGQSERGENHPNSGKNREHLIV